MCYFLFPNQILEALGPLVASNCRGTTAIEQLCARHSLVFYHLIPSVGWGIYFCYPSVFPGLQPKLCQVDQSLFGKLSVLTPVLL